MSLPLGGRVTSNPARQGRFHRERSITDGVRLPKIISRIFKPPTLDFETAIWEIYYLIVSPKRVYRSIYYHANQVDLSSRNVSFIRRLIGIYVLTDSGIVFLETKNKWARDDPSFIILLTVFVVISSVAWGVTYTEDLQDFIKLIFYMIIVDFLLFGVIMATIGWVLATRFFKKSNRGSVMTIGAEGNVEWAYCFDVHCNAFLMIWLDLHVIQFIFLPLLTPNNWISLFLGNTLYLIAFCHYLLITFLGYNALSILENTEYILLPIPVLVLLYLMSLFGFSMVHRVLDIYFDD